MIDNSYYSQEVHGPYELHDIGNLDLEEGGTFAAASSPTRRSARSMPPRIMPSSSLPGTPGPTRSSSRCISVRAARSIPTSISSSSSIRSAAVFRPRRTTRRRRPGWGISLMCGLAMTCARSTNSSRKSSACRAWHWLSAAQWARSRPMNGQYATRIW
jgi:hypothetical protein